MAHLHYYNMPNSPITILSSFFLPGYFVEPAAHRNSLSTQNHHAPHRCDDFVYPLNRHYGCHLRCYATMSLMFGFSVDNAMPIQTVHSSVPHSHDVCLPAIDLDMCLCINETVPIMSIIFMSPVESNPLTTITNNKSTVD